MRRRMRSMENMSNLAIIRNARLLAKRVHKGQYRRDGTTPYFNHPERVASLVSWLGGTDEQVALAYLHDVLEDA